jgi:hypothetical protein
MTQRRTAFTSFAGLLACAAAAAPAQAASCSPSQQYILEHGTDGEGGKPQTYQALSRVCEETLTMSNVKDAFILRSGAIAVIPKRDGISATAVTLSEFCSRFPKGTLRFVTRKELSLTANIGRAVRLDSSTATPCQKIVGG